MLFRMINIHILAMAVIVCQSMNTQIDIARLCE